MAGRFFSDGALFFYLFYLRNLPGKGPVGPARRIPCLSEAASR